MEKNKVKNTTYKVSVIVKAWIDVSITAPSMHEATDKAKELGFADLLKKEFVPVNDGSISVVGAYIDGAYEGLDGV